MCSNPEAWSVSLLGAVPALCVFTGDSIRVVADGEQVLHDLLSTRFEWPLIVVALLMAAPVMAFCRRLLRRRTVALSETRTI